MLLAQRLRELRARYDWSLHELAARSGVHYITIHRAEKGSTRITAPVVMALARTLQVSTDYLLGMDANAASPAPQPPVKRPRRRTAAPVG
jgi:transcriptional regulator with XRE-family HTH domain